MERMASEWGMGMHRPGGLEAGVPAGAESGPEKSMKNGAKNVLDNGTEKEEGVKRQRRFRATGGAKEVDAELAGAFRKKLCALLDADDVFGRCASLSHEEKIARMFLASAADKAGSDFNCAVSPKVRQQVPVLFYAAAALIEERSGMLIQSSAEINHEGFGRALLYSGRIILALKSLRVGFPFPFTSEEKAVRYGVACVEEALAFLGQYEQDTALHGLFSLEG